MMASAALTRSGMEKGRRQQFAAPVVARRKFQERMAGRNAIVPTLVFEQRFGQRFPQLQQVFFGGFCAMRAIIV